MRPPLFSGGNGHVLDGVGLEHPASMRPPLFSGGNGAPWFEYMADLGFNEASALQRRKRAVCGSSRAEEVASMRPPLFSGGNAPGREWRALVQRASMRPPLFSGGNSKNRSWGPRSSRRFNEASALQRRKRGATAYPDERVPRFNEASALQRRKLLAALGQPDIQIASMRPPLFSGGNSRASARMARAGMLQ